MTPIANTTPESYVDANIGAPDSRTKRMQAVFEQPIALMQQEDLRSGPAHHDGKVNWVTAIFMGVFHVGAIAALFFFSWTALVVAVILYFLAINVGIGMTYHRLLTHRGYKTPKWLEYLVTICGTLALEGGPIFWVATHRVHHQH